MLNPRGISVFVLEIFFTPAPTLDDVSTVMIYLWAPGPYWMVSSINTLEGYGPHARLASPLSGLLSGC